MLWTMDLLRSVATSNAKTVICWISITMGALYALNLCRNRLLIIFAGFPASVQKFKKWRTYSAIFRLQLCRYVVYYVYNYKNARMRP